jgi:hypothetical protein
VDAIHVGTAIISTFLNNAYCPKKLLTDKGSVFTSAMIGELGRVMQTRIDNATVGHHQTIGLLERSHAGLKKAMKINESASGNDWRAHLPFAVFNHNTRYNGDTGYSPAALWHGREPVRAYAYRFSLPPELPPRKGKTAQQFFENVTTMYKRHQVQMFANYQKYKAYYDRQAEAEPLEEGDICLLLSPRHDTQHRHFYKMEAKWNPFYMIEMRITNQNYIVRYMTTAYTQCVHRMRLRKIKPTGPVMDIARPPQTEFVKDPRVPEEHLEPQLMDREGAALRRAAPPQQPKESEPQVEDSDGEDDDWMLQTSYLLNEPTKEELKNADPPRIPETDEMRRQDERVTVRPII